MPNWGLNEILGYQQELQISYVANIKFVKP